jgi:uncharacterized protein (DUF2147 family)
LKHAAIALMLAAAASAASAQSTPAGLWKSIDDETKKEKSLIRITDDGGVLSGKLEKLLDPATRPDAACDKCSDERKGKPLVGMTLIRNVKAGADGTWEGGDILDPNNGKVYNVRLKPIEGGSKLEVRGFIGAPLFGRTQTWMRVE